MRKAIVAISGMHCASCASVIESALRELNGVMSAKVSFDAKKGLVVFDGAMITKTEIGEAIERLGYRGSL